MFKRNKAVETEAIAADPYEAAVNEARALVADYKRNIGPLAAAHKETQRTLQALIDERDQLIKKLADFDENKLVNPFDSYEDYTAANWRRKAIGAEIVDAQNAMVAAKFAYMEPNDVMRSKIEVLMRATLQNIDARRVELKAEFDRLRLTQ